MSEEKKIYNFCVPADFSLESAEKLINLNNLYKEEKGVVHEVYGSIKDFFFTSSRKSTLLPSVSCDHLFKYASKLEENGIGFNYTLNGITLNNLEYTSTGFNSLLAMVDLLHSGGINCFTIGVPMLSELIKKHFPSVEICASAVIKTDSPLKALEMKKLGADRIVLFEDQTRNFSLIKKITQLVDTEIIINQDCLLGCISRDYHRTLTALYDEKNHRSEVDSWILRCKKLKHQDIGLLLKIPTLIRPEDLHYYQDSGVKYFKIIGRESTFKNILSIIELYLKGENKGNFFNILPSGNVAKSEELYLANKALDGFLDFFLTHGNDYCQNNCENAGGICHHCGSYSSKIVYKATTNQLKLELLLNRYLETGPYKKLKEFLPAVTLKDFATDFHPYFFELKEGYFFDLLKRKVVNKQLAISTPEISKSCLLTMLNEHIAHCKTVYQSEFFIYKKEDLKFENFKSNNANFLFLDYNQLLLPEIVLNIMHEFWNHPENLKKEIKPVYLLKNSAPKENLEMIKILKSLNCSLIFHLNDKNHRLLDCHNYFAKNEIDCSIRISITDETDFSKLKELLLRLSVPNLILSFDNPFYYHERIDFLNPQLQILTMFLFNSNITRFDSEETLPFQQFMRGNKEISWFRYKPRWLMTKEEVSSDLLAGKILENCLLCPIFPYCRGHYLSEEIFKEKNISSDLQKKICDEIKKLFLYFLKNLYFK